MRPTLLLVATAACGCSKASPPARPTTEGDVPITRVADATLSQLDVDFLAIDGDTVWVTNYNADELVRIDAVTAAVAGRVALPDGACKTIAVGDGAVWAARCTEPALLRIDGATMSVTATYPVALSADSEAMVAFGEGSVWVTGDRCDEDGRLFRVDPQTGAILADIPVAPRPRGIAIAGGSVWVTSPDAGVVTRVDAATNVALDRMRVGWSPRFIAAGAGAVWVLSQGTGTVVRIDPADGSEMARIETEAYGLGGDIAAGVDSVWVRGLRAMVSRIDPARDAVVATYGPSSGSGGVRVGDTHVWITAHDVQTMWRVPL